MGSSSTAECERQQPGKLLLKSNAHHLGDGPGTRPHLLGASAIPLLQQLADAFVAKEASAISVRGRVLPAKAIVTVARGPHHQTLTYRLFFQAWQRVSDDWGQDIAGWLARAKPVVPADALVAARHVALWPQPGSRRPPNQGSSPYGGTRQDGEAR